MAKMCGTAAVGYPTAVTEPLSNSARLAARSIADGGTPVGLWTTWRRRFPALNIEHCPSLLLVAAHPDDETLGLGATAAKLIDDGVTVQVVVVTDGEAAYPDAPGGRDELAKVRRDELVAAAACLGMEAPIFLGIPDGEVTDNEERLVIELEAVLDESQPGTWCAATWRGDGHPDHEATGRAAAAASRDVPAAFIEYPIWMWHWAIPDDPVVPWNQARRIPLAPRDLAAKVDAMQCFASQLKRDGGPPLLPRELVERQLAVGEIVFV